MVTQDLAYDKGGGFLRCLMLFANVDPTYIYNENINTAVEYRRMVETINDELPSSILRSLSWNSDIHAMTEKLYKLKYKSELKYIATSFGPK